MIFVIYCLDCRSIVSTTYLTSDGVVSNDDFCIAMRVSCTEVETLDLMSPLRKPKFSI